MVVRGKEKSRSLLSLPGHFEELTAPEEIFFAHQVSVMKSALLSRPGYMLVPFQKDMINT